MKKIRPILKATGLTIVLLLLIAMGMYAQNPSYLCELRNDIQVDAKTFEFDVYLLQTGTTAFDLATIQFGVLINADARNGGIITASLVNGTSELNAAQIPTAEKIKFINDCVILTPMIPSFASRTTISDTGNGTRVGTFRLTNTVNFGSVQPNLTWSWSTTTGYPTKVFAYVGILNTDITVQASHTTNNLSNGILNQVPNAFNVTGGGSYCAGNPTSIGIGLTGSETGVNYQLYIGGSTPVGTPIAGTGSAISFAMQTDLGTYTVKATNAITGITNDMSGSATITINPIPAAPTIILVNNCDGTSTLTAFGEAGATFLWNNSETTPSITVSADGTYSVTQAVLGCVSQEESQSVTIVSHSGIDWYVNDNSITNDTYTTAIGNDGNVGTSTCPFATITKAISMANTGDIIWIDAGTFNEKVVVNKTLTLKGASETNCILDGTGLGAGSGIYINNSITGVTIEKFTIQNHSGTNPNSYAGIYAVGGNDNLTVKNCTLKDNVGGSGFYANGPINEVLLDYVTASGHSNTFGAARGIVIWNGLKSNISITNCTVFNNNCCGIELQDGTASGVLIQNNLVYDNGDNGFGLTGLQGPGENLIKENTVTNCGRFGIEIKNPNGSGLATGAGRVVVENNTVSQAEAISDLRDMVGIAAFRRAVLVGNVDVPNGVVIQNNTISGYTQASLSDGFGIVVEGINHSVLNNNISGCDVGIQQQVNPSGYPGDADQNNLADQYFGRGNSPMTCAITITGNTFGSNGVDTRNIGSVGGNGIVVNTNTGKTFCSIQTAINDATTLAGHTLQVSAGTYNEQITINKALTINGADGAIIDGTGLAPTWTTGVKIKSGNVTFNNIDVTNFKQDGIVCGYEASIPGNLQNIHITNCKISNIQPGYWGFGIYVGYESEGFGYVPPKLTAHLDYSGLLIENNEITNTHSSALVIQSITGTPGTLQVLGNNIHDNTTNSGIWIDCARNITIENNTVNNNKWGIEFSAYAESENTQNGLYGPKDITVEGNVITNNTLDGIALYNGWPLTIAINNNKIEGNASGVRNYLSNSLNATCNWWGTTDGNSILTNTVGNVTYSPWLVDGTDNLGDPGFQPVSGSCDGSSIAIVSAIPTNILCGETSGSVIINWSGGLANYTITCTGAPSVSGIPGSPYTINGLSAGDYTITITDVNGTFATADVTIQNLPVENTSTTTYYPTIQAAIDAATHGDVIEVCGGTYDYSSEGNPAPSGLIKVTKGVTIKAVAGVRPIIDGSGFDGVFKIHPSALSPGNTVIIEGFEIKGNEATGIAITMQGCFDVTPAKVIIRDNWFHGMVGGIDFWGAGAYLPTGWTSALANVEIIGNKFYNMVISGTDPAFGVMIEDPANWDLAGNDYAVKIEHNEFSNLPASGTNPGVGIVIPRANDTWEATNVFISGNSFASSVPVGIAILEGDVITAQVVNNSFDNNTDYAILATGIENPPVNATCNWFGSTLLATINTKVVGAVTYIPWLTNGTDNSTDVGFQTTGSCSAPCTLSISIEKTDATCPDRNNGTASVLITGGNSPSISWTNGETTPDIGGLVAGTYSVTVTNIDGCSATETVVVSEGIAPIVNESTGHTFCSIQAAIHAASSGDELLVNTASFTEGPQILIDKNITLRGLGISETILYASSNTGGAGDARGWFLVNSGIEFNLKDITLDGNGKNIMQGVRNNGTGTIDHVAFNNISYQGYNGIAVVAFGNLIVSNCAFTNIGRIGVIFFGTGCTNGQATGNTYTGKGAGDWLDYGVEIGGGAIATITNCNISNNKGVAASDGSTSAAIIATTYYGAGTTANISGCTLTNNTTGIDVGFDGSDESSVTATHNKIFGNTSFGISSTNPLVNAENNWWGDASGPNISYSNTCGTGDAVSANVDFNPWWTTDSGTDGSGVLAIHNITKDTWYCKIQDAIDDPVTENGDEISVPAGSYVGNIIVSKGVELHGANYGVSCSDSRSPESVLTGTSGTAITITADNVKIDGFKVTNPNGNNAVSVSGKSGTVIRNNVITGIGNTVLSGNTHAVAITTNTAAINGATISDNCFSDIHGGENPSLSGAAAKSNNGSASAIGVGWSNANFDITNLVVEHNSISGISACTNDFAEGGKGAYGIQVNVGAGSASSGKALNPLISENTVSNLEGFWAHAIGLEGDTPGAMVVNNLISDLTDHKTPTDAVGVEIEDNDGAASVVINNNSFTDLGLGIQNVTALPVSANCNWYGVSSVPGVTALNSGSIDFDPWLSSGTNTSSSSTGFIPEPNSCNAMTDIYVNDASTSGDGYTSAAGNDGTGNGSASAPFATISKAVSMAMVGSRIYVDAGTYQEQVQIGKSLDIIGLDRTIAVIKAPATLSPVANANTINNSPIIYAFGVGNEVNIQKITVDGDGGRSGDKFYGVYYYEASGTFTNSRITAIRNNPFSGVQGVAAFVANHQYDISIDQTVTVSNSIIDDYQKCGIIINELNTQGIVTGNTVTGQNIPEVTAQNGIQFGYGAFGTITGNTVINNIWNKVEHPHTWTAAGILLAGVGVDASNTATGKTTTVGDNILNGNENALSSGKGGYGYDSNPGLVINANTFNNNKIHVALDEAGTAFPNASDVYDRTVLNPALPEAVYGCIQYAIDEAVPGNTLNASAHTFTEKVNVHTSVILNGANQGTSCSGSRGSESIIDGETGTALTILSNGVTVDGFTIHSATGISDVGFSGLSVMNNRIQATATGLTVSGLTTTATEGLSIQENCIDLATQLAGSIPTIGIYLNNISGTEDATITGNNLTGAFYGYLTYALNTTPKTTFNGGTITGVMQGVSAVNVNLVSGAFAPSVFGISNISMSGFTGNYPAMPNINFHAGVYVYTGGSNLTDAITATVDQVSVTGTGKVQQDCAGLSFGDFSTGAGTRQNITVTGCTLTDNLNRGINIRGANALVDVGTSTLSGNGSDPFGTGGNDGFGMIARMNANVNIHNCFITNPSVQAGYKVTAMTGDIGTVMVASNNSLDNNGNVDGKLASSTGTSFTADCNWWGSACSADFSSLITPSVAYSTWITNDGDGAGVGFQPTGSCGNTDFTGTLDGSTTVCEGSADHIYTAEAGMSNYIWTIVGGSITSGGNGNDNAHVTWTVPGTQSISVTYQNSYGCELPAPMVLTVTVNPLPVAAGAISGPASFIQGSSSGIVYSIPEIEHATSYAWEYSGAGATINGSGNSVTLDFASGATDGILTVKGHNDCGDGAASTLNLSGNRTLNLTSVLLEGLYDGSGVMRQAQNGAGPQYLDGSADHITVELHSASNYSVVVFTATDVPLSTSGAATITIPGDYTDSYYITLKHRNSIETTTATTVSFATATVSQSFGSPINVYGLNLKTADGHYLIYGGDVTQDGVVDASDMNAVDNASTDILTGYHAEDANGDGLVDASDMNIVDNNSTAIVMVQVP